MYVAAQGRAADSDGTRFEPAADGAFDAGEAVGEGVPHFRISRKSWKSVNLSSEVFLAGRVR